METALILAGCCISSFILGIITMVLVYHRARRLDMTITENLNTMLELTNRQLFEANMEIQGYAALRAGSTRNIPEARFMPNSMNDEREAFLAASRRQHLSQEDGA